MRNYNTLRYSQQEIVWKNNFLALIGSAKQYRTVSSILKIHSFKEWTDGCYKMVYIHDEYPSLVFKVYFGRADNDSRPLDETHPAYLFYLKPLFQNRRVIIQKKVDGKGGSPLQAFNFIYMKLGTTAYGKIGGLGDIHSENCSYHDYCPYFFDYLEGKL